MTQHQGLPVAGYTTQSEANVALVNQHKDIEERLLRHIDEAMGVIDPRWGHIARTHFEQGFMALNRAVFKPQRIALPEDAAKEDGPGAA